MTWLNRVSNLAVDRLPSRISPGTHLALEYGLAAATAGFAFMCLRKNKAAAVAGFIAAGAQLTNALMTGAPGGAVNVSSFPLHGRIDRGNAAIMAALPKFMGFSGDPESRFFYAAAVASSVLTGMTDYTGTGERAQSRALAEARE